MVVKADSIRNMPMHPACRGRVGWGYSAAPLPPTILRRMHHQAYSNNRRRGPPTIAIELFTHRGPHQIVGGGGPACKGMLRL